MSGLRLGLDFDQTVSAAPGLFHRLAHAVQSSGGQVHIITGLPNKSASTQEDYENKKAQLDGLGFPYDVLYVAPNPVPEKKAAYCKAAGIDLLIDNKKANAKAASKVTHAAHFLTPKKK